MSKMFHKPTIDDTDTSVSFVPNATVPNVVGHHQLAVDLFANDAPVQAGPPAGLLTTFHAVAEHRSITHAATVLCLPGSMVNQQIARLEAILETELFIRDVTHVSLTPHGRALFNQLHRDVGQMRSQASVALHKITAPNIDDFTLGGQAAANKPVLSIRCGFWGMASALAPYEDVLQDLPYQLNFTAAGLRAQNKTGKQPDIICYLGKKPIDGFDCTQLFREELRAYASVLYPVPKGGFSIDQLMLEPRLQQGHDEHINNWHIFMGHNPNAPLPGLRKDPYTSFLHYHRALLAGRGIGIGLSALFAMDLAQNNIQLASPHSVTSNRACFVGVDKHSPNFDAAQDFAMVLEEIFS